MEKNSDKGVFCWGFFCNYIFLRFKMVETFIGGGGGATFYNLILFFFGGGGWGVQILISIGTYITCDFSGGGGGPDHLSLSGFAHG